MGVCNCDFAGTNACFDCPNYGTFRDGFGNEYRVIQTKHVEVPIDNLKGDLKDCKFELCFFCKNQKFFDAEWCKKCRWHNNVSTGRKMKKFSKK